VLCCGVLWWWLQGPFGQFRIAGADSGQSQMQFNWRTLRFSPDGKHLLLSTSGARVVLLDAFDGKLVPAPAPSPPPLSFPPFPVCCEEFVVVELHVLFYHSPAFFVLCSCLTPFSDRNKRTVRIRTRRT
jgi:hypothetical protein